MSTFGLSKPTFYIDSADRLSGTSGNFEYKLNMQHDNNWDQMVLSSSSFPKSYFTVGPYNNTFELYEDNSVISNVPATYQTYEVTIPNGFYNAYDFAYTLKELLDAKSAVYGNYRAYEIDFLPKTFKFDIIGSGGSYVPRLYFRDNSANLILGFLKLTSYALSGVTFSEEVISAISVNFQFTNFISVKCSISSDIGKIGGDITVLAKIPVQNYQDGANIEYTMNNLDVLSKNISKATTSIVRFSLHDDEDRIIDFNEQDIQLVIMLYRHNPYFEMAYGSLYAENVRKLI